MAKIAKRLRAAQDVFGTASNVSVEDAVALIKKAASAKFDETVEIAMNLGVDPRHADQMVRGVVTLPNGTGKTVRVAVFARGAKADEAKAAGADIVGAEDLMETIQSGKIEFDRCIATPDMMPLVGRLGKILGPRNLMPNPKVGTVTPDVSGAVKAAKGGAVEYRVEKAGIIHAGVGKASFSEQALAENIKAITDAVQRDKKLRAAADYQRVVNVWVSSSGQVTRVELVGASAQPELDEALRGDPDYPPTLLSRAHVLMFLGRFAEAADDIARTIARAPRIAQAYSSQVFLASRLRQQAPSGGLDMRRTQSASTPSVPLRPAI